MTVQDVRTVTVPRQAGPVEPPPAPAPAPAAPLLGKDRPLSGAERQFALGLVGLFLVLETLIVGGLLLAQTWG